MNDRKRLARDFCVSESTFLKISRLAFDVPLLKYVNECRLSYSIKELILTDKPIMQIAEEMGYDDPSYFSRCFKGRWKMTPADVRKHSFIAGQLL